MFVGVKMSIVEIYPIPPAASLAVVTGILALGVGASVLRARRTAARLAESELGARSVERT
jgi:predicted tellurium resistance membrane protein TerC